MSINKFKMKYEELHILVAVEGLNSCKSSSSSVSHLHHQWFRGLTPHYRNWILCLPIAPGIPRSATEGHDKFKHAEFQTRTDLADLVASCSTMLLLSMPLFSSLLTLLEVRQNHFPLVVSIPTAEQQNTQNRAKLSKASVPPHSPPPEQLKVVLSPYLKGAKDILALLPLLVEAHRLLCTAPFIMGQQTGLAGKTGIFLSHSLAPFERFNQVVRSGDTTVPVWGTIS